MSGKSPTKSEVTVPKWSWLFSETLSKNKTIQNNNIILYKQYMGPELQCFLKLSQVKARNFVMIFYCYKSIPAFAKYKIPGIVRL